MINFEEIFSRLDGSYVITHNGYPYHVPNEGEFAELWQEVHAFTLENPDKVQPEPLPEPPPPPTPEEEVAIAKAKASNILSVRMQREMVQEEDFTAEQFALFAKVGLFPEWMPGEQYAAGNRIVYGGVVYEVIQAVTAQTHQPPGSAGMLAVYRPISADPGTGKEPDGSLGSPFIFIYGMDVYAGKYYSFKGAVYLAKTNMTPCVWNPGTPGLWQWELIG